MASLLSTLFSSRDSYLSNHISKINNDNSFPIHYRFGYEELIRGMSSKSVIVSGGMDIERSVFLLSTIKSSCDRTIILHNGNSYLNSAYIQKCGVQAEDWDSNIYKGMNKTQMLSLLAAEEKDEELLFFYAYAFEVCEVLGIPVSLESINSIDWLGISWQEALLMKTSQRERALDLLSRFDKQMAENAVKGMCRIERLSRSNNNKGKGIDAILSNNIVLTKEVHGSNSILTKQCFEVVEALAESGVKFTLILDDVFLPEISLIRDNYKNVRLILSAEDITQLSHNMMFMNRNYSVIVFGHTNYGSAKKISEAHFGEYDKLMNDITTGNSKTFLASTTYNASTTVRRCRELRLKPEEIVNLPFGIAVVHLINGQEGTICIRQNGGVVC